jgi:hypothetical protein
VCLLTAVAALSLGTDVAEPAEPADSVASESSAQVEEEPHRPWEGQFLYGKDLLTDAERKAFWRKMRALEKYEDQLALWRVPSAEVQQRAWDRGLTLEEPPEIMAPGERARLRRPIYGIELMTNSEIEAYRAKEARLSWKEQELMRREHAEMMRKRARERGLWIGKELK